MLHLRRWVVYSMVFLAFALVVGLVTKASAGTTGGIQGHVTDSNANSVPDVQVSVVALGFSTRTITDSRGFYALAGLPPDTYLLTFSKSGFQTQSVPGVTVTQDQVQRIEAVLKPEVKTLGKISVRSAASLVQPGQPADTYTVNARSIDTIAGVPQTSDEAQILTALPGVNTDYGGFISIRGAGVNETGWQLEGLDVNDVAFTEPANGGYGSAPLLNGVASLSLSTGGYDVSAGASNGGIVNQIVKRGAYPGSGQATATVGWQAFHHELAFDYGNGTPDNRWSYYISNTSNREAAQYGDGHQPLYSYDDSNEQFRSINDGIVNVFYRFGSSKDPAKHLENELQYFGTQGAVLNVYQFGDPNPNIDPYVTNSPYWQLLSNIFTGVQATNFLPLYPGQVALNQNIGYFDHTIQSHMVQKLNFKHQFSPSSFGEFRVFRYNVNQYFTFPWNGGQGQDYGFRREKQFGMAANFTKQLSDKHKLDIGGQISSTIPTAQDTYSWYGFFALPLETTGCQTGLGWCYIAPLNAALNSAFGTSYPTTAALAPLTQYPNMFINSNDTVHRSDAYISDRWSPNPRLTLTLGLRYDASALNIAKNAADFNESYFIDPNGNVIITPPAPIGNDVTRPFQFSPRLAVSYQLNSRDVARFSYGKNIDFPNVSYIMDNLKWTIDPAVPGLNPAWQSCTIASGCFHALPGYSPTCTHAGVDPAHGNTPCNDISNLFQSFMADENTNYNLTYNPVKPQHAVNFDASFEHDFGNGTEVKITPYYRHGTNYVIGYSKLLKLLPGGFPVNQFLYRNEGETKTSGFEFDLQRQSRFGLSGFFSLSFNNSLQNFLGDFFGYTSDASIRLGHFYRNYALPSLTGHLQLGYNTRNGLHVTANVPFTNGFYYGVGKKTFTYVKVNGVPTPMQVLNTDLVSGPSAYYYTDPANPGTVLQPNIVGSLGTPEKDDAGSLLGPKLLRVNLTIAHDLDSSGRFQAGLAVQNLTGNYNPGGLHSAYAAQQDYYYQNNGFGAYGPQAGKNSLIGLIPYQRNALPQAYPIELLGPPRSFSFFVTARY